jgi:hypothetical protein
LGGGILFAEDIQRPIFNGRVSEVRVMETSSKIGLEREAGSPAARCSGQLKEPTPARTVRPGTMDEDDICHVGLLGL